MRHRGQGVKVVVVLILYLRKHWLSVGIGSILRLGNILIFLLSYQLLF